MGKRREYKGRGNIKGKEQLEAARFIRLHHVSSYDRRRKLKLLLLLSADIWCHLF